MEMTMRLPMNYNVLSEEEMTYTSGGANAAEALLAWIFLPYGWFKGTMAIREYSKANPDTWLDTGLDALSSHMESSAVNMLYDIACALSVFAVCATGIGLIPTALIVLI